MQTAAVARRLASRFVEEARLPEKPLRAERLHISLHHVGDYRRLREKFVYAARQAGQAVTMPPFDVTLRAAASLDGPPRRPFVLLGEDGPVFTLHERLRIAMSGNGLRAARRFMPHMTLFYGAKPMSTGEIEPIRFTVRAFSLIHSKLWLTKYETIGCWRLGD